MEDWNRLFHNIPNEIEYNTITELIKGIKTHDDQGYSLIKDRINSVLKDMGDYEAVCHPTGSDAIEKAILWSRYAFQSNSLFKMKKTYHGLSVQSVEQGLMEYKDLELQYFDVDSDGVVFNSGKNLQSETNAIVLIEPLYIFSQFGEDACRIITQINDICKSRGHILIVDEVRSGVFKTGSFVFAQQMNIRPQVVCFSKGLALCLPLAIACYDRDVYDPKLLKTKVDNLKSNLTINSLSLNRAIHLLDYFELYKSRITDQILSLKNTLHNSFSVLEEYEVIKNINLIGTILTIEMNKEIISKNKLRYFRMLLLDNNIIIRHFEDNYLYINFPFDVTVCHIDQVVSTFESTIKTVFE